MQENLVGLRTQFYDQTELKSRSKKSSRVIGEPDDLCFSLSLVQLRGPFFLEKGDNISGGISFYYMGKRQLSWFSIRFFRWAELRDWKTKHESFLRNLDWIPKKKKYLLKLKTALTWANKTFFNCSNSRSVWSNSEQICANKACFICSCKRGLRNNFSLVQELSSKKELLLGNEFRLLPA